MRILMVTDTYAPARNGVAMWVDLSVRELRARGHEVEVLTYTHPLRPDGGEGIFELPSWIGLDTDFMFAPILTGLPDEVERGSWDVVHVHHPVLLGPHGVRVGRKCGAAVVYTCHSVYTDYLKEYYWGAMHFLEGYVNRRMAHFSDRCDVLLAPASRIAEWVRETGATVRIEPFETPADTTRIACVPREEARRALGLGGEPVALYVGRIADEKRVDVLVDEFDAECRDVAGAVLVLAGTGVRFNDVERQIRRRGLEDRVRLLGPVKGEALSMWYSAADVCVSASRSEGGPLTVVEAMACACPSVSLAAPGFVDRVTDGFNGLLVEDEPGALGRAMARVLRDPELRASLSEGSRERAVIYTPEANTERLLEIYRTLLQ